MRSGVTRLDATVSDKALHRLLQVPASLVVLTNQERSTAARNQMSRSWASMQIVVATSFLVFPCRNKQRSSCPSYNDTDDRPLVARKVRCSHI